MVFSYPLSPVFRVRTKKKWYVSYLVSPPLKTDFCNPFLRKM
nr:MAG TPA: hypothetical protein [Caudoviricetes sp.]